MSNMLYNKSKQTEKLDDNSQNLSLLYNNLDFVYTFKLLPHEDRNMQQWQDMDLGGAPRTLKDGSSLGMVAPACNLRTWEAESGLGTQKQQV